MIGLGMLLGPDGGSAELRPTRVLLCKVLDVDFGAGFGDLTIQCEAIGDGQPEIVDLMLNKLDVQILEAAIARLRRFADEARLSGCNRTRVSRIRGEQV